MEVTVSLGQIGQFILVTAGIVLLIILCIAASNLIMSIKRLNSILKDVNAITTVVADETKKIDDALCDLKDFTITVNGVKEGSAAIKKSIDSITSSINAIKKVIPAKKKENEVER